ncbi:MAG: division/cell wall cluster transcriptional repressor MraZ [Chromatiales bacterium]|nr:division/cell wall cluster transcriptional repressor MraZ [Chromatiales bacterium]
MFRGIAEITLDAKGRFALPTRHRAAVQTACQGHLVCTLDIMDSCLLLYPLPEWERVESNLASAPNMNAMARDMQRWLIGHATEIDVDAQGRLLLPSPLRNAVKLDRNMVMFGQGRRFELWAAEVWAERSEQMRAKPFDPNAPELPDALRNFSL